MHILRLYKFSSFVLLASLVVLFPVYPACACILGADESKPDVEDEAEDTSTPPPCHVVSQDLVRSSEPIHSAKDDDASSSHCNHDNCCCDELIPVNASDSFKVVLSNSNQFDIKIKISDLTTYYTLQSHLEHGVFNKGSPPPGANVTFVYYTPKLLALLNRYLI
jgi:hypothetical protein